MTYSEVYLYCYPLNPVDLESFNTDHPIDFKPSLLPQPRLIMLALTGCTGKIGGAVLHALLEQNLVSPSELVICTSSNPEDACFDSFRKQGISIRHSNYDDPASMVKAFSGCDKLFLVSTPAISMDFNSASHGNGREKHHFAAIDAALKAGVRHIYYTSLAFGGDSEAGVMQAHLRTEAYLKGLSVKWTVIREGLYNESWPLYFGYYYDLMKDKRDEIVVAGDGPISWTSIKDLGLATALVIVDRSGKYEGRILYLSNPITRTLKDIAKMVSEVKGRKVEVKIVGRDEYVDHYVHKGKDKEQVEWWVSSYKALQRGECDIKDRTFSELVDANGVKPKPLEETVREMMTA
jgi:uncharacterized protein YbjT (DUF2867 family)